MPHPTSATRRPTHTVANQCAPNATHAPAAGATTPASSPSPEVARDAATEQIHQLSCSPRRRASQSVIDSIVSGYRRTGSAGMTVPSAFRTRAQVRQLANMTESGLRQQLEDRGIGATAAGAIAHEIKEGIQRRVQQEMRPVLKNAVRQHVRQLRAQRDQLLAALEAPEGTPQAEAAERVARSRGVSRSELAAQLREGLDAAIERFEAYDRHLDGNGWDASDFPELAARTIRRTFGEHCDGSMAAEALTQRSAEDEVNGYAEDLNTAFEIGHTALEVYEAYEAMSAAAITGAGLAVAGLGASLLVHHEAKEYHDRFIADVRALVEGGTSR